jgi:hypothetical protein
MNPVVPKSLTRSGASAGLDRTADSPQSVPVRLKLAASFEPCPIEGGDEVFPSTETGQLHMCPSALMDRIILAKPSWRKMTWPDGYEYPKAIVQALFISVGYICTHLTPVLVRADLESLMCP